MLNIMEMKLKNTLCLDCGIRESQGLQPLFQKDGRIIYEPSECKECENENIKDWI